MPKTIKRQHIVDTYMPLCLGLDRMLGLNCYKLLYDGRWEELDLELERAAHRFKYNLEEIKHTQEFIGRLK